MPMWLMLFGTIYFWKQFSYKLTVNQLTKKTSSFTNRLNLQITKKKNRKLGNKIQEEKDIKKKIIIV